MSKINWLDSEGLWLLLILLLVFAIRLLIINVSVIDWDESVYFTIAQDIANGGVPYKTTWDTKGPLLFFILVPVTLLFDDSIPALRVYTSLYLLLSMYFVYLLAKRLFSGFAVLIPPLVYGLMFISFGGLASNGELFMMLPVILALLTYLDYEKKERPYLLFLSGFFSCAAFLIKATALFSAMVVPLFILYFCLFRGPRTFKSLLIRAALYAAGFLTPAIILTLYLASQGAARDFYETYFIINRKYVGEVSLLAAVIELVYYLHWLILRKFEVITIASIIGTMVLLIQLLRRKLSGENVSALLFILAMAVLSLVGVIWGRRMFPHYYLQMGLAYALIIGFAVYSLGLGTPVIKAAIAVIAVLFFIQSPVTRTVAGVKSTDENYFERSSSYEAAEYIQSHSEKDETMLVIGGQPIVYFLSNRRPAIKYFWWTEHHNIMYRILNLEDSVPEMLNDSKPDYIVFYDGEREEFKLHLDYIDSFIDKNYSLENSVEGYKIYRLKKG